MRELFSMDQKDYKGTEKIFSRPSVRAIIVKEQKVLMIWSKKYDYYKFPGGGVEEGENHREALAREVREETGFTIIPESIKEYGHVTRRQLSDVREDTIFEQDNFYYFCETEGDAEAQSLEAYEAEEEFTAKWMYPFDACWINRHNTRPIPDKLIPVREAGVLEMLDKYLRNEERRKQERDALSEMEQAGLAVGSKITAADYEAMLEFVRETLGEPDVYEADGKTISETENVPAKKDFHYSRFGHTKRVLGWARRLYAASSCKEKLDYEAVMTATIFHDVGRAAADNLKLSHARAGEPIVEKYLLDFGFSTERAEYIKQLVGLHSDKHLMKDKEIDRNLLLLMEADLLDDMGALGIVMDCMVVRGRNPMAGFEDSYDHIMRFTHHLIQDNPMVSPEGIAMWEQLRMSVNSFADQLKMEMSM